MRKLILILLIGSVHADVNTAVDNFLRSLQTDVNVPTITKNQSAGVISFGGVSTRSKTVNLQPIKFTPPSYKASCGNINFYSGAMSFMTNTEQLLEFLQDTLMTAAVTSAVTALKAVTPNLAGTVQSMFDASQKALGMFNNSCQLGMALANSATSSVYEGIAKAKSQSYYEGSDASSAEIKSTRNGDNSSNLKKKLKQVEESYQNWVDKNAIMNPRDKFLVTSEMANKYGSIIWKGLQSLRLYTVPKEQANSVDIANLVISLTGDLIIYPPNNDGVGTAIYSVPPTITDIQQFMTKNNPGTKVYNCTYFNQSEPGECKSLSRNLSNPEYPTIDYKGGIVEKIQTAMKNIQIHFETGKTLTNDDMLIIAISPIPIFSVAQTLDDVGMTSFISNILDRYTPQISFEILQKLVNISLTLANQAASQRSNKHTEQAINALIQNISNLQNQINSYPSTYKKVDPVKLLQKLNYLKGYAQSLLSPELMEKVNFAKQLGNI